MRTTMRHLGWFVALGLVGCAGDGEEFTTFSSVTVGEGSSSDGDDDGGSADDGGPGSADTNNTADDGVEEGPVEDGGTTDGGSLTDGGTTGGRTDGGPTDGGRTDAGTEGTTDGGSFTDGGGTTGFEDGGFITTATEGSTGGSFTDGGGTDGGGGDCCIPQRGAGCSDAEVQDCVCAFDDYCCTTQWDDICVTEATDNCSACGGSGGTGGTDTGGGGGGSCCDVQDGPGCDDANVQDCVCGSDDYCCTTQWDDICVSEANDCGAMCQGGGGGSSCCDIQDGPGCDDPNVQDCVCSFDDFCCRTQWDDVCVSEAADCGAAC